METRLIEVTVMVAVLLSAAFAPSTVATSSPSLSSCGQTVVHDVFMSQEAAATINETGEAVSRVSNTKVRVEDATGFVRLHATNPNGYCVAYQVEISPDVVPAADLGTVSSNSEHVEARWRAVQNLSDGSVHTKVTFVLPSGANATFAPSTVRVQSLSWTGTAKREGSEIWGDVQGFLGNDTLEDRTYEIKPSGQTDAVTVPLEKDGQRIEEYQAYYTINGTKHAVTTDASKPVYETTTGDSVTYHFNNRNAVVHWTANPTFADKVTYGADMYLSGIFQGQSLLEKLPFAVTPSSRVIPA